MRNSFLRLIYGAAVFVIAVIVMELFMNQGSSDSTAQMREATFPVVTMRAAGMEANELHGYAAERDLHQYRGVITPLSTDRSVSLSIDLYGQEMTDLSFEVRSVDGERLIETTQVTSYTSDGGTVSANFALKDLIQEEQEYMLVLLLTTREGGTLRYYTRIVATDSYAAREKLSFVYQFHENTFSKTAASAITTYIEPNAEGDNTTYAQVNIHSSYGQITWGDLAPEQVTEPVASITDMQTETASFTLRYVVSVERDGESHWYECTEYYRLRMGEVRINLLEFERSMEQIFVPTQESSYGDDVISLGITDPGIAVEESDGGGAFAFVEAGRLYSCTTVDNAVSYVYGFADFDSVDARDRFAEHEIRILNVDETGNVDFIVYGYMNRGRHEGELGVAVYSYNSVFRTVEERAFLPYAGSYELLKAQVERLSYLNKSNSLFLLIDETLYEVNLTNRTVQTVVGGLTEGSFQVADSGRMIAWKKQKASQDEADVILLTDLSSLEQKSITAQSDERINPLGFIGEDLIYGTARADDVVTDPTGNELQPMYNVKIVDKDLQTLENYEIAGYYVVSCEVEDNQITLHRLTTLAEGAQTENGQTGSAQGSDAQTEAEAVQTGSEEDTAAVQNQSASGSTASRFRQAADDQIVNAQEAQSGSHVITTVFTQDYETVCQIRARGISGGAIKYIRPKEVLFEGSRNLALDGTIEGERYTVYNTYGVQGRYADPSQAVQTAENSAGNVVDGQGRYIWKKGNRLSVNQIMAIGASAAQEGESSIAVCLQAVLDFEGVTRNARSMMEQGMGIREILEESIPGAQVLDLTGVALDSVLYYVSEEKPVIAITGGGTQAVLIVGYNEQAVVLMDPQTGTLYKASRSSAESLFGQSGNGYVAYLVRE
ncbi:MAG: hypothetical protein Q4C60_00155 [Eubacteriales bacterium]|nr:hypothetical protein [Eubacteriales bacterium]